MHVSPQIPSSALRASSSMANNNVGKGQATSYGKDIDWILAGRRRRKKRGKNVLLILACEGAVGRETSSG